MTVSHAITVAAGPPFLLILCLAESALQLVFLLLPTRGLCLQPLFECGALGLDRAHSRVMLPFGLFECCVRFATTCLRSSRFAARATSSFQCSMQSSLAAI